MFNAFYMVCSVFVLKKVNALCGNEKDMQIFEKKEKLSRKSGHLFVNTKKK